MNYNDYINGNVTSSQIQTPNEDWSDYFTSQSKSVPLDKTKAYAEGKAAARPASSYLDMAGVVTVRPAHELELRQRLMGNQNFQQKSVENRLAEEMRQYNQRYMDIMQPKAEPKDQTQSKTKAEPVVPEFDNNIEEEPVVEDKKEVVETPAAEPVLSVQEDEHVSILDEKPAEPKEDKIPGVNFVPGGMEFIDEPGGMEFVEEPGGMEFVDDGDKYIDDKFFDDFKETEVETGEEEPAEVLEDTAEEEAPVTEDEPAVDGPVAEEEPVAEEKPNKPAATKKAPAKKTATKKAPAKKKPTSKKK